MGFLIAAAAAGVATPADPPPVRKPWTTSKVVGSPDPPPPFKTVRAFPDIKFFHPLLMARCPGSDRLFVGEQDGAIYSFVNTPDAKRELFVDLRKEVQTVARHPGAKEVEFVYGLAFHPKFAQNRTCFVCYTLRPKDPKIKNLPDGSRVSRFKVTTDNPPRLDTSSEEILLTFLQGGHNGGDLHFGPDGMLYISTGDAADPNPPDPLNTGQDCSDLLSSVLRIDIDRKDEGKAYAIPKDNPFVGVKDVRPEIWAYGFRNAWRMSFDKKTGDLWLGDVGWELWEMVHKIEKGGNYGWSIVEGRQSIKPSQKIGPTPIRPPTIELPHTIAASVTGGYVYRGKKFPELVGAYVFGDWQTRRVWAARMDGDRVKEMPELTSPTVRIVAFGEDNAGELYLLDYDTGTLHTFERNDAGAVNKKFPTKLSETGIFPELDDFRNDGVSMFAPNARMNHDGAKAIYHAAMPGTDPIDLYPPGEGKPIPGQADWLKFRMIFPKDSVLVKTLLLRPSDDFGVKSTLVETQLLHFDGHDWRPYTFAWRDDQTDADLVPADGAEKTIRVPWLKAPIEWTFHSRNQCLTCHNPWANTTLGLEPGQLHSGGTGLATAGSLNWLIGTGIVRHVDKDGKPLPAGREAPSETPVYSHAANSKGNVEQRARGYLHANCAHCHRFGGGGGAVVLELDARKTVKEMDVLDVLPKQGDFGIPNARIVAPGEPERSVLFWRMAKSGPGHMPRLGCEKPDYRGTELIREWILSLGKGDAKKWVPRDAADRRWIDSLSDPVVAYGFARTMHRQSLKDDILAAAAKMPPGLSRDLLEHHFPPDPKGRKIGTNPRPASILALTGNATNGETLFHTKDLKCAQCHKVGDKGVNVGPDLTQIAKTRTRAELLESLLEPSRRVEPQYAAYLVKTADGRALTGLLVKRDAQGIVLKDAEGKEVKLAADDVEAVQPSRVSLMPDGLLAGLTPQEAADLLEFLVTRK